MKNLLFFFISATIILASCQSDGSSAEKSVEEVQAMITNDVIKPNAAKNANQKPQEPTDTVNVAKLKFPEPDFEFGTVNEGEKVSHVFEFTNTGKEPLVISNARGSCGCTVPEWPKEPIAPGEDGQMKVIFKPKPGQVGDQRKTVTVKANIPGGQTQLNIIANVEEK